MIAVIAVIAVLAAVAAIAAITVIGAARGPGGGPIGVWLVDPHPSPARNWQTAAPIIGKRTGRRDGSQPRAREHAGAPNRTLCA